MTCDLSIIIPAYRVDLVLFKRCLESIFSQNLDGIDYEVFVVLDGEDENRELLNSGLLRNSHLRYEIRSHGGEAAARNFGMQFALGEWFLFVDADDYLADDAISKFMQIIKNNPAVDMVVSNHARVTGHRTVPIIHYGQVQKWESNSVDYLGDVLSVGSDQGTVWSKLFRTDFVKRSGELFDCSLVNGVDQEFMTRLVLREPIIYAIPDVTYGYVYNPSSVVRRFDSGYADKVFKTLEKVSADISAAGLAQHFSQVYEAYCCDRLLLLIMNYICNPNAELSYTQRRGLFNEVVGREPIASALKNSDLSKMSCARQIMLHFARGMNFSVVAFIASVRNIQRKILM